MNNRSAKSGLPLQPRFTKSASSIIEDTNKLIKRIRGAHDDIVRHVVLLDATFTNVIKPLAHAEDELNLGSDHLCFYQHVSPYEDVREASAQAKDLFTKFRSETLLREDLYQLIDAVLKKDENLDPESRLYLERKHREYRRNGLTIPAGKDRDRFKEIKQRVSHLISEYRANLGKPKGAVWFEAQELEGIPQSVLDEIKALTGNSVTDGKLSVPLDLAFVFSILQFASNSETRKRYSFVWPNRCMENVPIFKEVIVLRDEAARLLVFDNHAQLRLQDRMAQTPEVVNAFLHDIRLKVKRGCTIELDRLRCLKKDDLEKRGEPAEDDFYTWDLAYYRRLELQNRYSVDKEQLSQYFELETTVNGMLEVYSHLFGLSFEKLDNPRAQNGVEDDLVWHPDVRTFAVYDAADEDGANEFLGFFYLDLFRREHKSSQDCNRQVHPSFMKPNGQRHPPATALFCNFTKPTTTKPTLLRHPELITLFHETGHAIHYLVSKTRYSLFHGGEVADDFCEAPSQLLEKWCWTPQILKLIAKHYSYISPNHFAQWKTTTSQHDNTADEEKDKAIKQPPQTLPDTTIDALILTKHTHRALDTLQNLHLSLTDQKLYQPSTHEEIQNLDVAKLYNSLKTELIPLPDHGLGDNWAHSYASWTHPVDNYDCGYYGYLYSQVFADDIWKKSFQNDPLSSKEGRRYRRQVLEKGASQPEMKTMEEYLGRMPDARAFYEEMGFE